MNEWKSKKKMYRSSIHGRIGNNNKKIMDEQLNMKKKLLRFMFYFSFLRFLR